jgi:ceramide glucosyltransferase
MSAVATIWYGAEMLLCYLAGWHISLRFPLAALIRDLLLPAIWVEGWRGSGFVWRGTAMRVNASNVPPDMAGDMAASVRSAGD